MSDINQNSVLRLFCKYGQLKSQEIVQIAPFEGLNEDRRWRLLLTVISDLEGDRQLSRIPPTDSQGIGWEITSRGRLAHDILRPLPHLINLSGSHDAVNKLITPILKDRVLRFLCNLPNVEEPLESPINPLLTSLELNYDVFSAVMKYFERNNLVAELQLSQNHIHFTVRVEAHDLESKGGFMGQELVFQANIEKMQVEIEYLKDKLKPDFLDSLNKLSGYASAIFGGLSLLKP